MKEVKNIVKNIHASETVPLLEITRTQFFNDHKRRIDYILSFKPNQNDRRRDVFLDNLKNESNLEIEIEYSVLKNTTAFVKIHAPNDVLNRYSLFCGIPIKFKHKLIFEDPMPYFECMNTEITNIQESSELYQRAKESFFKEPLNDFTTAERCTIVNSILKHTAFSSSPTDIGIGQLLHQNIFTSAYPLHDSEWEWPNDQNKPLTDRQLLAKYWADFKMLNKTQPLNLIEKYFGAEVGIYFAWLGFYNKMLIYASIFGLLTFFYSIVTLDTTGYSPIKESCESNKVICPKCGSCNYTYLKASCGHYKLTYVEDNTATMIFSIFMAFWATIFMELWKRKNSYLNVRWHLITNELLEEDIRPEFENLAQYRKTDKYTGETIQYLPLSYKTCRYSLSVLTTVFMILIVLLISFCIILCELTLKRYNITGFWISFASSVITFFFIRFMRRTYISIANWLTKMEVPRTQFDFDKSFMFKVIVFSFINSYGKLFYAAFFKGKFYSYPGDPIFTTDSFPIASDICDPAGCASDVFMQLMVIMVIKPVIYNAIEVISPMCSVWINRKKKHIRVENKNLPSWEQDYELNPSTHFSIIEEFEEMVIQYGFTTLLVASFPLAPLCALINNLFEIRIDARKMLKLTRRPNPRRKASFVVWFDTLQAMTYIAVVTNALYITFTSQFIQKLVYMYEYDKHLNGYVDFTLSEYGNGSVTWPGLGISKCYYSAFKNPPGLDEYRNSFVYYYVLSVKLGCAISVAAVIFTFTGILAYAIPDMPASVRNKIAYDARQVRRNMKK